MKKTILASAVLLTFGSLASAAIVLPTGEVQVDTAYGAGQYQVQGESFFTVSKNETNLFDAANGNITVDFAENSKLKAESPHFVIVAGKTNEITFNLGNSGEMELISSSSGAQQSICFAAQDGRDAGVLLADKITHKSSIRSYERVVKLICKGKVSSRN